MLGMLSEQTISSIQVAEMMKKRHSDVVRDIEKYLSYFSQRKIASANQGIDSTDFFIESVYLDAQEKERKCYQITRKGCEFLAHKMTGQKGGDVYGMVY